MKGTQAPSGAAHTGAEELELEPVLELDGVSVKRAGEDIECFSAYGPAPERVPLTRMVAGRGVPAGL